MSLKTIKHFIEQSWLLIVSSFLFGLLIAVANAAWLPKVEQNRIAKMNRLMTNVLPAAGKFDIVAENLELKSAKGQKVFTNVYKALDANGQCIGWSFKCSGGGFADVIELVVGVDEKFEKMTGFDVLSSNETPGFGSRISGEYYKNQFNGAPVGGLELSKTGDSKVIDNKIVAISGATVTSQAVVSIFNTSFVQVKTELQKKGLISNGI